jgi:hypothetical protein
MEIYSIGLRVTKNVMPFRRSRYGFLSTVKSHFMSREMAFYILRSPHRQPVPVFSLKTVNLYQDYALQN